MVEDLIEILEFIYVMFDVFFMVYMFDCLEMFYWLEVRGVRVL